MFVISNQNASDLFKASGAHKYVKRTGGPGNYKYWYKNASGQLVAAADADHEGAKREHVKRLVSGKLRGAHEMSNAEMISHTGIDAEKFRQIKSNLTSGGRTGHMDYSENELHEAKHSDVGSDEYNRKVESITSEIESRGTGARPASPAGRSRTATPATPARPASAAPAAASTPAAASPATPAETPAAKKEREKKERIKKNRALLSSLHGINLDMDSKRGRDLAAAGAAAKPAPAAREDGLVVVKPSPGPNRRGSSIPQANVDRMDAEYASRTTPTPGGPDRTNAQREADMAAGAAARAARKAPSSAAGLRNTDVREIFPPSEEDLRATASARKTTATAAQAQAREATAAARAELASPETAAAHTASPELASADAPIEKMVRDQAAGKNPYVERAKKFYDKIKGDMTTDRKDSLGHFLKAIEQAGHGANEAAVKAAYKTIQTAAGTGDSAWGTVKKHIESGLFHAPQELIGNPPVNVDLERMKRGFGRMQFERMKPFLGDAFTSAHPNAPAPYPTYDDLKTWEQHGSRPEWAEGRPGQTKTKRAVPEEFHKSMPKGPDGKVLNPPGWMPLHMTPVWSYVASQDGASAFGSSPSSNEFNPETQKLSIHNQDRAGNMAGHFKSNLRKFIQMRGENSFVDIPSYSKDHAIPVKDFYKSDSDAGFHRVMTNKVFPMSEFIKFHKEQSKTKKSFSLCVDDSLGAVTFKKAFTIEDDMKKSELISKIKKLKKSIGNKA